MGQLQQVKLGLALSGGGAKGAYQIGFFGAMEQCGLWENLTATAGSSIGSVNAVLAATRCFAMQKAAWDAIAIEQVAAGTTDLVGQPWDYYPDRTGRFVGMTLAEYLAAATPFPYTQSAMAPMLEAFLPLGQDSPATYCCAYNMERLRPEYFCLNGHSACEASTMVLASCCIPILFAPVELGGCHYCDGGLTPPYYTGPDNSDILPLVPLKNCGCNLIIAIYLNHRDALDPAQLPVGCQLLEVYPSQPLEQTPGSGTLDFSTAAKAHHMEMGHLDGCRLLGSLEALLGAGASLEEATRQLNRESQECRLALVQG